MGRHSQRHYPRWVVASAAVGVFFIAMALIGALTGASRPAGSTAPAGAITGHAPAQQALLRVAAVQGRRFDPRGNDIGAISVVREDGNGHVYLTLGQGDGVAHVDLTQQQWDQLTRR